MKWPHTVTVWRRTGEVYRREVLDGVLWQESRGSQLRRGAATADNGVEVLLPRAAGIAPGDWMAKGDVSGSVQTAKDIAALGGLRVAAVDVFDFGGLPHVEVTLA